MGAHRGWERDPDGAAAMAETSRWLPHAGNGSERWLRTGRKNDFAGSLNQPRVVRLFTAGGRRESPGWPICLASDDWALIATADPAISLLIRKSTARPGELCHTARPVPLARLVQVAGARWAVEECFQAGKNEAGLDHYQVRLCPAWYRYVTVAMLALAWLAVTRASLAGASDPRATPGPRLITSANEIRRMFVALCSPPATTSTPVAGGDGGTATSNAPVTATTSGNASKISP